MIYPWHHQHPRLYFTKWNSSAKFAKISSCKNAIYTVYYFISKFRNWWPQYFFHQIMKSLNREKALWKPEPPLYEQTRGELFLTYVMKDALHYFHVCSTHKQQAIWRKLMLNSTSLLDSKNPPHYCNWFIPLYLSFSLTPSNYPSYCLSLACYSGSIKSFHVHAN